MDGLDSSRYMVKQGFVIEQLEPTVIYRSVSVHKLDLKHLFLSQKEVTELQSNLTSIGANLKKLKLDLDNVTVNCHINLLDQCTVINRKMYYTLNKLDSLTDEINSLAKFTTPSPAKLRRSVLS